MLELWREAGKGGYNTGKKCSCSCEEWLDALILLSLGPEVLPSLVIEATTKPSDSPFYPSFANWFNSERISLWNICVISSDTVCSSAGINCLSILKLCVGLWIENLFLNLGEREEIISAITDEKATLQS